MYLHYTVHLYCTLYHNGQRSVSKKAACEEDLREKWNGDLWGHTEVARNLWLWFICRKPLGRIGHNMLKWLVIQILNKLALCLYKNELCIKIIEKNYNMAAKENFVCHKHKICQKSIGNYLRTILIPWIHKLGKTWWSYEIFCILTNYYV